MQLNRIVSQVGRAALAVILLADCSSNAGVGINGSPAQQSVTGSSQQKQDLIYVSADANPNLSIYTFPQGKYLGGSDIYGVPYGLCSDAAGNVYVTALEGTSVYEFSHGATTPSRTIVQPGYFTAGCSVDAKSGDLAVADLSTSDSPAKHGAVSIFANASGTPKLYKNSNIDWYQECAYDGEGNLFVVGSHGRSPGGRKARLVFAELPKNGTTLKTITIPQQLQSRGGIQWDGKYIVLSGNSNGPLYRYTASSNGLTFKDSINFNQQATLDPFWIQNNKIISAQLNGKYSLGIWGYPKGGDPKKLFTTVEAFGVTVSAGGAN